MTAVTEDFSPLSCSNKHDLAQAFVAFAVQSQALQFGQFTTKAGRLSPYFFNAAAFSTGARMRQLARFYARALELEGLIGQFDIIFGPAYKGIPLATALALTLADMGLNLPFVANRKELKTHGEGGALMGAPLQGRALVIDDVVSAGTALRESLACIKAAGAQASALLIAIDRQEKATQVNASGTTDLAYSAVHYVQQELGLQVCSIANLSDILTYAQHTQHGAMQAHAAAIAAYRERYGA